MTCISMRACAGRRMMPQAIANAASDPNAITTRPNRQRRATGSTCASPRVQASRNTANKMPANSISRLCALYHAKTRPATAASRMNGGTRMRRQSAPPVSVVMTELLRQPCRQPLYCRLPGLAIFATGSSTHVRLQQCKPLQSPDGGTVIGCPTEGMPNLGRRVAMLFEGGFTFANFVASLFSIFIFVLWLWLLMTVFGDLFRRHDASGLGKVAWVILLIVLPYVGLFAYILTQGRGMAERSRELAQRA